MAVAPSLGRGPHAPDHHPVGRVGRHASRRPSRRVRRRSGRRGSDRALASRSRQCSRRVSQPRRGSSRTRRGHRPGPAAGCPGTPASPGTELDDASRRHPADPVALAGVPLVLGRAFLGPGEVERVVGAGAGGGAAGRLHLLARRPTPRGRPSRAGRPTRRRPTSAAPSRARARSDAASGGAVPHIAKRSEAADEASGRPGQGARRPVARERDDVAAEPVGPGRGLLDGRGEPDRLHHAQAQVLGRSRRRGRRAARCRWRRRRTGPRGSPRRRGGRRRRGRVGRSCRSGTCASSRHGDVGAADDRRDGLRRSSAGGSRS